MKTISIIKIILILSLFFATLYSRNLYIWTERKYGTFYCFDKDTHVTYKHEISKKDYPMMAMLDVNYISNFAVASYQYYSGGWRGGLVLLDMKDETFREIEISDLIPGYFSVWGPDRDKTCRYVMFLALKVLDYGVSPDEHQVDYFRWDIHRTSRPEKLLAEEYSENKDRTVSFDQSIDRLEKYGYLYDRIPIKRRIEIPDKEAISNQINFRDYAFLWGNNLEVWAHEENRFYTLRDASDVPADEKSMSIHMISIDGMRSVRIGWK